MVPQNRSATMPKRKCGDVVGGRGRVPNHDQSAGNIDEAEGGEDDEEQVQEPGDSPWLWVELIFPPYVRAWM